MSHRCKDCSGAHATCLSLKQIKGSCAAVDCYLAHIPLFVNTLLAHICLYNLFYTHRNEAYITVINENMNTDGPTAPRNRDQQQQKVDFTSNALDGECSDCEGVSSSSGGSYYDSAGGGGGNKKREDPPSSLLQTPAQLPRDELTAAANNDPPMNSTAVFKFDRDFSRLTTNTPGNFAAVGQTPMTGASLGSINPTPHTTTGRGILKSSNYKTATVNALDAPMNTGISAMGLVRGNNPLGPTPLVRRNDSGKNKQQEDPQQQQQQQKLPTPSPGMHYHFPAVSSVKTFDAFPPPKKRMSAVEEEDPNMLRYASTAGSDQSPLVTKGSTMEDDTNENENSQTPLTQPQTQTDCSLGDPSASGVSPQEKHQHPQSAGKYPAALSEFPFYFDGYASWVCRHCNHISPYYRGENYVWHYPQAPPNEFVDQHLVVCHGLNASSDHAAQQPPHALTDFRFHPTAPQMPGMPPSFGNKMGAPDPPTGRSPPPILPKNNSEIKALGAHQYFPRQPYHPQSIPMMPHQQPYMMPPPGAQQPPFPFGLNGTKPKRRSTGKNISPKGRPSDDQTYAKAIEHLEEVEENMADLTQPNTDIGSSLVEQSDSDLITDYFFHIMKQLIVCRFAEADRKTRGGKRENINIGYGGLQCRHCSQTPCTRKFYWSNVDRLSNSFAEIPTHVLKCKYTPEDIKDSLLVLKGRHAEQMQSLARGSQKVFFRRMWRRLHDGDETGGATPISQKSSKDVGETGIDAVKTSKSTAARMLADSLAAESVEPSSRDAGITESPKIVLLAIPEDQDWLSDDQCLVRNNIEGEPIDV